MFLLQPLIASPVRIEDIRPGSGVRHSTIRAACGVISNAISVFGDCKAFCNVSGTFVRKGGL